jgi:hypothetical protein
MMDREAALAELAVGDIFDAEAPNGALCICLVVSVDAESILARRITSQEELQFDRRIGVENVAGDGPQAVVTCVVPLPLEIHNVFLALDRKYAAVYRQDDLLEKNHEYFILTEAEKNALKFIRSHWAANPLAPLEC